MSSGKDSGSYRDLSIDSSKDGSMDCSVGKLDSPHQLDSSEIKSINCSYTQSNSQKNAVLLTKDDRYISDDHQPVVYLQIETDHCNKSESDCKNKPESIKHVKDNINITHSSDNQKTDCLKNEVEVYFLCGMCHKWFSNKASMIIHFISHFNDCPACETCGETFTEPQDYADHCIKHVAYTCCICEKPFFQKEDFEEHKSVHNLRCFRCKMTFPSKNELQVHYSVHEKILNLECKVCHNYYSSKESLRFHMTSQHSIKAKLYACELCNDKFTCSGNLNRHIRTYHKNLKPHICHLCGKKYSIKGSLETHLLRHKGEKPYTCLICSRSFADKRQFKRHGVEHIPAKIDPCEICGKVFQTAAKLKIHFKAHTNPGNFQCPVCPRHFNYSSHLKRHLMVHNGERPFKCEVCEKGFIVKTELRKHLRKRHAFDKERIAEIIASLPKNAEDAVNDVCYDLDDPAASNEGGENSEMQTLNYEDSSLVFNIEDNSTTENLDNDSNSVPDGQICCSESDLIIDLS